MDSEFCFFIRKCTMAQKLFLVNLLLVYYSSQLASALLVRESYGLNAVNFKIAVYNVGSVGYVTIVLNQLEIAILQLIDNNYPIRIFVFLYVSIKLPPRNILTLKSDGNYTDNGINAYFYRWIAERLNFTYAVLFHSFILTNNNMVQL